MLLVHEVGYITDIVSLHITQTLGSGEDSLCFEIAVSHKNYKSFQEEMKLSYGDQRYVIKSIDERGKAAIVDCRLDLDDLQKAGIVGYREENQHLYTLLNFALTGTGWTNTGADRISARRTTELEGGNALDLLRAAQKVYKCVFQYDTISKVLTVFPLSAYENKGVYFTDELNISKLLLRGDSFDFCTRLIPIGEDGLKIDDINGGKSYVENYTYSNKIVTKVWKDDRYKDKQELKDEAIEKLKVLSQPNRTYSLDVIDLAEISGEYGGLSFSIGDKVTLIDRNRNVKVEHQVVKLVRYPDKPEKNKVQLCATAKGFDSVVQNLKSLIDGTNVVVNLQGRRISKLTLDIEAFTLELANYYTKGETEHYIGSQIKAEADRIDLVVSHEQSRINSLTGELEVVSNRTASLELTSTQISATVSSHTGQISSLTQTVNGFNTRISNAEGQVSTLSQTVSSFNTRITNAEGSVSTLTQTVNGFSTRISTAEGNITSITQTADKINWLVASGTSAANFTLTDRAINLVAENINLSGYVTFSALSGSGTTIINGANITTGSISSSKLTVANGFITTAMIADAAINNSKIGNLAVGTAEIQTGAISTAKIQDAAVTNAKIANLAVGTAQIQDAAINNAKISNLDASKITTGSMSADRITTGTLDASKVTVTNLNANNIKSGTIDASLVTVTNLQINQVKYGTYPIITCSGSYGNPVVAVGKDQASNSVNPTKLSIYGTTINLGDDTSSLYTTNINGGYVNIYCGDTGRINIGGSSSNYMQWYSWNKEFRPSGSGFYLGTSSYPWTYGYFTNISVTNFTPSSLNINNSSGISNIFNSAVNIGGSSYYVVINSSRECRPNYNSSSYPFYLGTSSYPWYYGYVTNLYATSQAQLGNSTSARLGFFGTSPASRQSVSSVSTSGTLANAITGINNLITALKNYGLIG